ncbi:MAG TPA: phosphatidylglycerophosphatase A, partial [Bryobacteraceae bacterium]|nr:phosphatidylglycerophosphatase A [Bryobacteraceae bacterium]
MTTNRSAGLAKTIATWFGCGLFPWAPGTVGSLAALLCAWAAHQWLGWGSWHFLAA